MQSGTAGGSRILSFYGQDGVLRRQNNERQGKTIEYVSLNYGYRARACNGAGCGGYSGTATVSVLYPPSGAPSLTVP
ncbi:hypothetical protein E1J22_23645, partial [Xanthomonas citri]|nr:hypothetical protein [Xanthomonas citri]